MDYAVAVSESEGVSDLLSDPEGVFDGELNLAVENVSQRLALHIWHHVVKEPICLT
jgi:hypothetical protein